VLHAPHIRTPQIRFGDFKAQLMAEDLIQHLQTQLHITALLGHNTANPITGLRGNPPDALGIDLRIPDSAKDPTRSIVAAVIHRWISLNRVIDASQAPGSAHPDSPFFH